jgi:hypothetical protein
MGLLDPTAKNRDQRDPSAAKNLVSRGEWLVVRISENKRGEDEPNTDAAQKPAKLARDLENGDEAERRNSGPQQAFVLRRKLA